MKKKINILIVDDHPVIIEACSNILLSGELGNVYSFTFDSANDCDSAVNKINNSAKSKHFDVLILDVKLPPSSNGKIISGEDLAIYSKKMLPKAKIIMLTMFNESFRIQNILTQVNPDGLLIKDDLTSNELTNAFTAVLNDPPYYSPTVIKHFRKQSINAGDLSLDDVNRKIIFYLSQGAKTKDLINYVHLSLSAIEKRKAYIKEVLECSDKSDEDLIIVAKKRGLV